MSTVIISVSDIVEDNGKTIRENNLERQHTIPLGALVEIQRDSDDDDDNDPEMERYQTGGVRLFVVKHSRDCDGTPLYDLSFDKTAQKELDKIQSILTDDKVAEQLNALTKWNLNGKILRHYVEDSLVVIKLPNKE